MPIYSLKEISYKTKNELINRANIAFVGPWDGPPTLKFFKEHKNTV